jgi:hypothetical protein
VAQCEETEQFNGAVIEITNKLASLIQSKLSEDDPRDEAIKETLTQCAAFLGDEFQQFMPLLLEQLIVDAKLDLDFKMTSVDETQDSNNTSMRVKVKGFGEQNVSMNTDALVRKASAFSVLAQISDRMGKSFAPYVEPLLPIVREHVAYDYNKKIRSFALKILNSMLISVGEPNNIQIFQDSVPIFFQQLEKSLTRKDEKVTKVLIKGLANCLRTLNRTNDQVRNFLTADQISSLGPYIKSTLDLVKELKNAHNVILQATKGKQDIDEEDMEKIKDEFAKIGRLGS